MSPAWDQRGAPIERSQPFTTRQMNINPCTTMATQHNPGTGGYNSMDSTCTSHDTRASGPTANYTGSAGGPKELASYTGHITAWVSQSSGWNGLVQSRSPVPERNGSAHENGLQNRHMGSEYPQIMKLAAAICAKNEDENPVILSAVSGITLKEYIERDLKVGNNVTEEEYKSSWLNVNKSLDDLDKEPGVRHQMFQKIYAFES
ncbi:unnamed protein product [Merluccius merluccius]